MPLLRPSAGTPDRKPGFKRSQILDPLEDIADVVGRVDEYVAIVESKQQPASEKNVSMYNSREYRVTEDAWSQISVDLRERSRPESRSG
jgi:hypothetical protein